MPDPNEHDTSPRSDEEPTNWPDLGRRFQGIQARLIHGDREPVLSGDDFYGEALRRLLTRSDSGWMTRADHDRLIRAHHVFNGSATEEARRQAREARARYAVSGRAMRAELAAWLREVASNERIVPSRYRRDGVLLAADWIDPATPAWPYTLAERDRESPPPPPGDHQWSQVLEALRAAGEQDGKQAAAWWEQYTIGGSSRGDAITVARTVLAGIDACDPAVLDFLPAFDLAGYDADRYRIQAPPDAPEWDDLSDADQAAAIDAARDGFTTAVEDGVAARCAALLDGDTHPTA
ncbi:hypothetical protein [Micromonospora inyonensis]|uniref:Uncharacterized protein n=1 Tax=Micromonospora inyonensis TaxID=47866 RepID=A0A1C6RKW8_9ACTN|nr:hypothetical protein [Micromonospora inyonensis]SCL17748.1 hypothetical protein GA0074694_2116 [Micromonospora inyonensis]